jgi:probable F420-dependent oxidoreductase
VRFTVEHPVGQANCAPELYGPDGLAEFARAAENAGFDAIAFTEHPAPSKKWLNAGGHASLDPLSALAFCAAASSRIRLLTYLLVLPYRNPMILAKSIATVDLLSGGRLTVGAGGGYLRSEFAAMGVDFEDRGALMDEALDVLTSVWAGESFSFQGKHFTARDQVQVPGPVQRPHPPLWVGGNGRKARRRAARSQGWIPLLIGEDAAATTRTSALSTPDELAVAIAELREFAEQAGRDPDAIDVQVQSAHSDDLCGDSSSLDGHGAHLKALADAGVTWFVARVPAGGVEVATDALARYGREVIAAHRN